MSKVWNEELVKAARTRVEIIWATRRVFAVEMACQFPEGSRIMVRFVLDDVVLDAPMQVHCLCGDSCEGLVVKLAKGVPDSLRAIIERKFSVDRGLIHVRWEQVIAREDDDPAADPSKDEDDPTNGGSS